MDKWLSVPPIWIYIPIGCIKISSPSFGIFKSVCWYRKFVSILVLSTRSVHQKWRPTMLRATDSWKRCSCAWTIFNSRDPFTYYDWTLAPCGFLRLSVFLSDALNYFLPIPSHSMCKDRTNWKLSQRESSFFRESVARNLACLHFWRTDRVDKTLIKTNFPYQHTLWIYQTMGGSFLDPMVYRCI